MVVHVVVVAVLVKCNFFRGVVNETVSTENQKKTAAQFLFNFFGQQIIFIQFVDCTFARANNHKQESMS